MTHVPVAREILNWVCYAIMAGWVIVGPLAGWLYYKTRGGK